MAGRSTEQKKKGSSEATEVEVSRSGGSKKENAEDQEKMQLLTTSRSEKINEDGQEKAEQDLSLNPKEAKRRMRQAGRKKKKIKKDAGQRQNEREYGRKRKAQKRVRK